MKRETSGDQFLFLHESVYRHELFSGIIPLQFKSLLLYIPLLNNEGMNCIAMASYNTNTVKQRPSTQLKLVPRRSQSTCFIPLSVRYWFKLMYKPPKNNKD